MKRILFLAICFFWVFPSLAQIKPIENLTWEQWYNGHNNFQLRWDKPGDPHDNLLGYNIYRDHMLYRFQTDTILYHMFSPENSQNPYYQNCPESFLLFGGGDFYIHVTAVYDGQIESGYVDSVQTPGAAIGVGKFKKSKLVFYPNPTSGKLNIENQNTIEQISLFDLNGEVVDEFKPAPQIDLSGIPRGVYFLQIQSAEGNFVQKVVVR